MERLLCILIGYACGLIQTGFIIGKIKGIDIREFGSGNAGTTNVLRTMGAKYGMIVFIGDTLKCVLAVGICHFLFQNSNSDLLKLLEVYAALGTILGHNYPFYMKFRGGKGIAASAGLLIALGPIFFLVGILTFLVTFLTTAYVSLGSLLAYIVVFIEIIICGEYGYFDFPAEINRQCLTEFYLVFGVMFVIAFFRHRENIKRLLRHQERTTYLFDKPELDVDAKENEIENRLEKEVGNQRMSNETDISEDAHD